MKMDGGHRKEGQSALFLWYCCERGQLLSFSACRRFTRGMSAEKNDATLYVLFRDV